MGDHFTDEEIQSFIGAYRAGTSLGHLCQQYGFSPDVFVHWIDDVAHKELQVMRGENEKLKRMLVEETFKRKVMQETIDRLQAAINP